MGTFDTSFSWLELFSLFATGACIITINSNLIRSFGTLVGGQKITAEQHSNQVYVRQMAEEL